jgi:hypothetical protein
MSIRREHLIRRHILLNFGTSVEAAVTEILVPFSTIQLMVKCSHKPEIRIYFFLFFLDTEIARNISVE